MRRYPPLAVILAGAGLLGCVPNEPAGNPEVLRAGERAAAPAERAAAADEKDKWVTLKGQVIWTGGDIPKMEPQTITKDEDHCKSKGNILKETWVVNAKNKGIKNVVVYLMAPPPKEGEKRTRLPIHPDLAKLPDKPKPVPIDQPTCRFEPHVVSITADAEVLVIKNSSPIAHNAKYAGIGNQGKNPLIPSGGKHDADDLQPSDFAVRMECNIHPWMGAYIYVFDHPYHAVTNDDGQFEIKLAPAGAWRLGVWQEDLGWKAGRTGEEIVLEAGKGKEMKIELKPKKE